MLQEALHNQDSITIQMLAYHYSRVMESLILLDDKKNS